MDVPAQPRTQAPPPRIRIQLPRPTIEEGRWPVKRTVGEKVAAKVINNSSSGGMHYDESLPAPNGQASYAPMPGTYLEVP